MNEQIDATLSPDTRRERMIKWLDREGERSIDDLARRFGVSGMTIRRDLRDLASAGEVIRTHGGAAPRGRVAFEFRFLERSGRQAAEKQAIAERAVKLIEPAQHILLDSSTTTLAIARRLRCGGPATVITTSLPIASELFGLESLEVILLGGRLRKDSPDLSGALTEQTLEVLRAEVAFIGADAVDDDGSASNDSPEVARMLQRMAAAAERRYAVADHTKLGKRALMQFADLRQWDGLITDDRADPRVLDALRQAGVNVITPSGEGD